jgi:putative glutamine amidotransferase
VDPFHYGQAPANDKEQQDRRSSLVDWLVGLVLGLFRVLFATHSVQDYDPDRDQLEKKVIRHAIYYQLPVLGICRGAQLLNVVLGGSLHQNIGHFYTEETSNVRSILPRKTIELNRSSQLHSILQTHACQVNALHNQSIDKLGDDLLVSAAEPSGVVQAIEKSSHPFCLGVQWHPEYMPQSKTQQGLFRALVRRAGERAEAGGQGG